MKNKHLTVTIGIPAYTEEANIAYLLSSLLKQKEENFMLKRILVVSDASTDRTDSLVKAYKSKKITLFRNKVKKGQNYSQNLIFRSADTDIVILFEADTLVKSSLYLSNLIKPYVHNPMLGMIQGKELPVPSITLVGKVIEQQFTIFYEENIHNLILQPTMCSGRGGRLFTRSVYQKLRWPHDVPEDIYSLLWCKKNKIVTMFASYAICYYRCAQSISDYKKEVHKVAVGRKALEKYFTSDDIQWAYNKPISFVMKCFITFFISNPLYLTLYISMRFSEYISRILRTNIDNYTTTTTKSL